MWAGNSLTSPLGVLGNGRLGKIYSDAMRHLSNELLIHDPFIDQTLIPKMSVPPFCKSPTATLFRYTST